MISMNPVLTRGYTHWDRALLPPDEFEERVRVTQACMARDGLAALILFSNTYHCSGDLAWIAGWPVGGALVVLPEGEPRLYTFGGGRELFFQKSQIWLAHMSAIGANYGPALLARLAEMGVGEGVVGTVGLGDLPAPGVSGFLAAFAGRELGAYDNSFHHLRAAKRPRERLVVQQALAMTRLAAKAGREAFAAGASAAQALVAAERAARMAGALDFRGLANIDGPDLRPFEELSDSRQDHLRMWAAVNHHGYWADVTVDTGPAGPATQGVAAMVAAVRAGATAGEVAQAALTGLSGAAVETVLSFGLGGGLGQTLDEVPLIVPGSEEVILPGMLLSLRMLVPDASGGSLASALLLVEQDGVTSFGPA